LGAFNNITFSFKKAIDTVLLENAHFRNKWKRKDFRSAGKITMVVGNKGKTLFWPVDDSLLN
jgi:hypothetical protein